MQLPRISASALIAAACGSAATLALHWAYTRYMRRSEKVENEATEVNENRVTQKNDEGNSKDKETKKKVGDKFMNSYTKKERKGAVRKAQKRNDGPKHSAGQDYSGPASGRTGLTADDAGEKEDSRADDESEGNGEPRAKEDNSLNVGIARVKGKVERQSATVEMKDQGTTAKPETENKKQATDHSGYCKGEEDIIFIDRSVMQFMIVTMTEMEKKLIEYEGSHGRKSLLQQFFEQNS